MTKLTLQRPTLSQIVTFANGEGVVVVVETDDDIVIVVEIVDEIVVVEFDEGIVVLGVVVLLTNSSFFDLLYKPNPTPSPMATPDTAIIIAIPIIILIAKNIISYNISNEKLL